MYTMYAAVGVLSLVVDFSAAVSLSAWLSTIFPKQGLNVAIWALSTHVCTWAMLGDVDQAVARQSEACHVNGTPSKHAMLNVMLGQRTVLRWAKRYSGLMYVGATASMLLCTTVPARTVANDFFAVAASIGIPLLLCGVTQGLLETSRKTAGVDEIWSAMNGIMGGAVNEIRMGAGGNVVVSASTDVASTDVPSGHAETEHVENPNNGGAHDVTEPSDGTGGTGRSEGTGGTGETADTEASAIESTQ